MVCQKCGIENKEDAKFCSACGSEMVIAPTEPVAFNVNKAATVSALFAPIAIVFTTIHSLLVTLIFNNLFMKSYGYEFYSSFSSLTSFFSYSFSLAVFVVLYLIFTKPYRKELPLFLFLLAPGISALSYPVSYFLTFVSNLLSSGYTSTIVSTIITILVMFLRAGAAFFIIKAVFKKLLSKRVED
jgi:hypothetical protein